MLVHMLHPCVKQRCVAVGDITDSQEWEGSSEHLLGITPECLLAINGAGIQVAQVCLDCTSGCRSQVATSNQATRFQLASASVTPPIKLRGVNEADSWNYILQACFDGNLRSGTSESSTQLDSRYYRFSDPVCVISTRT